MERHNIEGKPLCSFTIAGLSGGSGKTIASLSISRAFVNEGSKVVCFKKGPDYIDAAWLAEASRNPCYNLDPYLMDEPTIVSSFGLRTREADVAIVEGNRGLFDGMDIDGTASTGRLAKMLGTPVLLVVDCTKATRTVAAMVLGCMKFDPELEFLGVVLNKVAGPRHRSVVTQAIETYTGLPVLGFFPRLKRDPLPMRHLGLTPADEFEGPSDAMDSLAELAQKYLDLNRIKELGSSRRTSSHETEDLYELLGIRPGAFSGLRIGVIRDVAFQFYYPENIEALKLLGAELSFLDSVRDKALPPLDGLYIGGGFPETQAEALTANEGFRRSLKRLIERGLPVYAECGGLMYLGRSISWKDERHEMVGAIPFHFEMQKKPAGHGYCVLEFLSDSPFFPRHSVVKGHEFHYSRPIPLSEGTKKDFCCKVIRGTGFDGENEGFVFNNTFSTYTHIHALGEKEWAETFLTGVARCKRGGN